MNITKVEENVLNLAIPSNYNLDFMYDLLLAYGKPRSSITRLKSGTYNLSKNPGEIYWKNNLFFKHVEQQDLHYIIDELKHDQVVTKHNPRFIIVSDFNQLLAIDTKNEETLDIPIKKIGDHYTFFLPWAGMEKKVVQTENIADIKAAERMARLYDEIIKHNESNKQQFYHALNVFFSRLLFCFFAEDTEVFVKGQFTNSVASHTQVDGSDLNEYLNKLFQALDVESKTTYPSHLKEFPYVNGGLFNKAIPAPQFNANARRLLLQCGELDWSQINPDIFGSMIQAVVHPGQRAGLGMHYTSVTNIMKVINPLFLENLNSAFEKFYDDKSKLDKLLNRIYKIKVMDPACGSGNFLIIAYKELRKLEHKIIQRIMDLSGGKLALFQLSGIKLENFYGIEIDDFAHEITILSLWLAKHQMNIEFKEMFGIEISLIPLKDTGNIVCGNALRLNWEEVCPKNTYDEVYIFGNPPYLGARNQNKDQKTDLTYAFSDMAVNGLNSLDYISGWLIKGSKYIKSSNAICAFVSTNSICQGEHVSLLWPHIFKNGSEIIFAHTSFKWTNNAKNNAVVTCIIIGIGQKSNRQKILFEDSLSKKVNNISPYLTDTNNIIVGKRSKPVSNIQPLVFGNQAIDGGYLILEQNEKKDLVQKFPNARKFLRPLYGAEDFIDGLERWCIWVSENDLDEANSIPPLAERFIKVKDYRSKGGEVARSLVNIPYRFRYIHEAKDSLLVLPRTTSQRRAYLPIGILNKNAIVTDAVQVIYDPETYIMGVLLSKLHMLWVKSVAGRLKTDLRYSNSICYNNFPLPSLSDKQKQMITNNVFEILDVRERYSEKTLGELYDPDKMPNDLKKAHNDLDEIVELCYKTRPFENDEERLSYLFKLYETMTINEEEKM